MDIQTKVNEARDLDTLLDALNSYEPASLEEWDKLEQKVDLCDLPTFGKEPESTLEIFSWDDERVLIQNTCIDQEGAFILVERSEDFGA